MPNQNVQELIDDSLNSLWCQRSQHQFGTLVIYMGSDGAVATQI